MFSSTIVGNPAHLESNFQCDQMFSIGEKIPTIDPHKE